MLPQPETVTDESSKAELNDFLAQEHALQAVRCELFDESYSPGPATQLQHVVSGQGRQQGSPRQAARHCEPDAPSPESWDVDKIDLAYRKIMTEAAKEITNFPRAAGVLAVTKSAG